MKSVFRNTFLSLCAICMPLMLSAKEHEPVEHPHEIRIGIGDNLFDYLHISGGMPDAVSPYPYYYYGTTTEQMHEIVMNKRGYSYEHSSYIPHFFVGYQYRFRTWFSFGFQLDMNGKHELFDVVNGYGDRCGSGIFRTFNMAIIPEVKFTYPSKSQYVRAFSGIGLGAAIQVEQDTWDKERYCEGSPAIQITLVGIDFGRGPWFGNVEVGALFEPVHEMICHKLLSLSVGYRF